MIRVMEGAAAMVLAASVTAVNGSAQQRSDSAAVAKSFSIAAVDARAALRRDAGRLWGARLDSVAWLGVNGKTILLTSAPRVTGYTPSNGVWRGPLPESITPANTSITWAGRRWAMILLPLSDDSLGNERLMIHEAMHVLQPSVLPAPSYGEGGAGAALLDQAAGRMSLRLEWRALAAALAATGAARDSAVHDALLFRAARYAIASPDEVKRERALDVKEGIPEYTGWKLSGSPRSAFITSMDSAPARLQSFIRAFPYYTGPAYAMLLDDYTNGDWRKSLAVHPDLQSTIAAVMASRKFTDGDLIRSELASASVAPARRSAVLAGAARLRAQRYGGATIAAAEKQRSEIRERQLAQYRARFIDGPTVRLRPPALSISFDPRGQASLGKSGTVMANVSWKSGDGSSLVAPAGALINQGWTELRVPLGSAHIMLGVVKQQTTIAGNGWTLVLMPGWRVSADGSSVAVLPPSVGVSN